MSSIRLDGWKCDACGHVWYSPRKPRCCARCKRRNWDTPNSKPAQPATQAELQREKKQTDFPTRRFIGNGRESNIDYFRRLWQWRDSDPAKAKERTEVVRAIIDREG